MHVVSEQSESSVAKRMGFHSPKSAQPTNPRALSPHSPPVPDSPQINTPIPYQIDTQFTSEMSMEMAEHHSRPLRVISPTNTFTALEVTQHRHCWKYDPKTGNMDPVWPREPDMEVARKLAIAHLPAEQFADAKAESFSEGAFHRLFSITSSNDPTAPKFLMRVALPVDPFFKTESEVATIQYIREHSSMPVPKVIAFSSSSSNPLGFEWTLMEKMDGVPIDDVWQDMPMDAKMAVVVDFAEKIKPILDLRFSLFGNIYFADIWNQVGCPLLLLGKPKVEGDSTVANIDVDIGAGGDYVIGRVVSCDFFSGKRMLLPADRGPFRTARELAFAQLRILGHRIRNLSPDPKDDYYSEMDTELASAGHEVIEAFNQLELLATRAFPPPSPGSEYETAKGNIPPEDTKVLWHHDMSRMNVLVHPETYNLVGVVDWESVSVLPALSVDLKYHAAVPRFLYGIEILNEESAMAIPERGTVSEEEEEGYRWIRDDFHTQLVRRRYLELVSPPAVFDMEDKHISLKHAVMLFVDYFETDWERDKKWVQHELLEKEVSLGQRDEEENEEKEDGDVEEEQEGEEHGKDEDGNDEEGGEDETDGDDDEDEEGEEGGESEEENDEEGGEDGDGDEKCKDGKKDTGGIDGGAEGDGDEAIKSSDDQLGGIAEADAEGPK